MSSFFLMGGNQEGLCLSSSCAVALFKRLLLISLQAFLYWTQKHQHHPPKNLQFTSPPPPPPNFFWGGQSKYRMYPRLWNSVARANGLIPVSLIFWFDFFIFLKGFHLSTSVQWKDLQKRNKHKHSTAPRAIQLLRPTTLLLPWRQ